MRIACVQTDVVLGDRRENIRRTIEHLERLAAERVDLAIFPECNLTGYCVDTWEDADGIALGCPAHQDGPTLYDELLPIQEACSRLDISAVVGYAWNNGMDPMNGAALFLPTSGPYEYYKSHLPELGLDRFCVPGRELPVFDTPFGQIGVLICFDMRFPEAARTLTLKGAELIVLPTNWPQGAEVSAEHICIARAAENRVFFATCNRVGTENGFTFIGRSKIIAPSGQVLAAAGSGEETIIADIDLSEARTKRNVTIPGKYETDVIEPRQPYLYRILAK